MINLEQLRSEHHPEEVRRRLEGERRHVYLKDAVFGGIDGCVTTFAVVAGAMGADLSNNVIVILGFANLVADGFSMAVSNYLGTKLESERVEQAREAELRHIRHVPEGEREELRQIFARKGFDGEALENIVRVISADEKLWVNTMLREELGLQLEGPSPVRAGLATFGAFLVVGFAPLVSFVIPGLEMPERFGMSIALAAVAFASVGLVKAVILERSKLRSAMETLVTGGGAAALAYVIGAWLRATFGA